MCIRNTVSLILICLSLLIISSSTILAEENSVCPYCGKTPPPKKSDAEWEKFNAFFEKINELIVSGNFDEAVKLCRQGITDYKDLLNSQWYASSCLHDPTCAFIRALLADALIRGASSFTNKGDYVKAADWTNQLITEYKDHLMKEEWHFADNPNDYKNFLSKVYNSLNSNYSRLESIQNSTGEDLKLLPLPLITEEGFIKPEMVLIEGGTFMMGSENGNDNAKPVHTVEISSFYMGKYEVTNKEYRNFDPGHTSGCQDDNCPVEYINWYDALQYCNWLSQCEGLNPCYRKSENKIILDMSKNGYRLPTEAEWEYACRAGTITEYYWGDKMDGSYCWYKENSKLDVNPVGQKNPNKFGLYDMIGNVDEWCWDWYDENYYSNSPSNNPTGTDSPPHPELMTARITRGGNWSSCAEYCRSAERSYFSPEYCLPGLGFRLCRSVPK